MNIKNYIKLSTLILSSTFLIMSNKVEAKDFSNIKIKTYETNTNKFNMPISSELKPKNNDIIISLLGDCTIGMDEDSTYKNNFNEILEKNGYDYFFTEETREILENDDITLANLEVALTTSDNIQEKQFNFKGDPDNIKILINGGVDVVNISNNHSHDYGEEGYNETIDTLNKYNMDFAGDDYICVKEVDNTKIGFFGLKNANITKENIDKKIKELKDLKVDFIIASVHWGEEGNYEFNETQEELGHYMIDSGVSIISGNHPHCLQGIEEYNNGIIAYSNGNFCFGGNKNPKDKDTMILQIYLNPNYKTDLKLKIIPYTISSTNEYNDFRPKQAYNEQAEEITNKILKLSKNLSNIID